eukprot:COSAG02_NODE_43041_length_378_cov_1.498208_1_plen_31_part_10
MADTHPCLTSVSTGRIQAVLSRRAKCCAHIA